MRLGLLRIIGVIAPHPLLWSAVPERSTRTLPNGRCGGPGQARSASVVDSVSENQALGSDTAGGWRWSVDHLKAPLGASRREDHCLCDKNDRSCRFWQVSRRGELRPPALVEPCVTLSRHTAPVAQPMG